MEMILAPSILAADFTKLGEQMKETEREGAQYIHFDVMDGKFVPSISFGMPVLASIRNAVDQIFDVHLMIEEPIRYVEEFQKAGADIITVHLEACSDVKATLEKIKACGAKAAISICPDTPVAELDAICGIGRYGIDHECTSWIWRSVFHPIFSGEDSRDESTA